MTGVGGTTGTIGTTKEEGSETTGGVETDAVNAIDGPTVVGGLEGRWWCPAAPDNSCHTTWKTGRDWSRPRRCSDGRGQHGTGYYCTASDAALTSEIGTSLTLETAIPVVAAAVTVQHLWVEPAQC